MRNLTRRKGRPGELRDRVREDGLNLQRVRAHFRLNNSNLGPAQPCRDNSEFR